jgi:hypothetical protein
MRYLASNIIIPCNLTRLLILFFTSICLINLRVSTADAQSNAPASPEKEIVVKSYKWGQRGAGGPGIIKEITLENKGKTAYKDIEIEVNLYTANDVPLGSLRSTIHQELSGESEKTFYNVNFGIMHSDAQKTVVSVVGGEALDTLGHPRDLIVVKNWEWTGGQYSTEGILKDITLENKSGTSYRDIEIQVSFFTSSGSKLGPSRAVIHDILPAKSEKTFHGINIGFRNPDAHKTEIGVLDAKRAPVKKVKPAVAKKSGILDKYKKKAKTVDKTTTSGTVEQTRIPRLTEKAGTAKTPLTKVALGVTKGTPTEKDIGVPPNQGEIPIQEAPVQEYEEEAIPKDDIAVKDFKWGGSVAYTFGLFREITLENKSKLTYSNIELIVEFYGVTERRPLGSYNVTIYDVLPANTEKVFRDVKVGYVNVIPQDIDVRIVGATVVSQ